MLKTDKITLSRKKIPWWQWINILSLDAPLIALLWQYLFAQAYRIHIPQGPTWLLALTVWWLYISDRSADVAKNKKVARLTHRHFFYHRYRNPIRLVFLPTLALGIFTGALYQLPVETLIKALSLTFCVGIYFLAFVLISKSIFSIVLSIILSISSLFILLLLPLPFPLKFSLGFFIILLLTLSALGKLPSKSIIPKEFIAAYLFAIGTLINVSLYVRNLEQNWLTEPSFMLCLLCFMNLLAISARDRQIDQDAGETDRLSEKNIHRLFIVTTVLLGVGLTQLLETPNYTNLPLLLAYTCSGGLLIACYRFRNRFHAETIHFFSDVSLVIGALIGIFAIWLR